MVPWSLVDLKPGEMPRWCRGIEAGWRDGRGWLHPYAGQPVIVSVEVERDYDLIDNHVAALAEIPLAARFLLRPDSESGWVSPDGRFWGCSSIEHERLLTSLPRLCVHDAALAGWVRVNGTTLFHRGQGPSSEVYGDMDLTSRQLDTLFDLGFVDVDKGMRARHWRLPEHKRTDANAERAFAVRPAEADRLLTAFTRRPAVFSDGGVPSFTGPGRGRR
jgi:hypothetical protein